IRVRETGERLPSSETPTIVPNHVSYFDVLVSLLLPYIMFIASQVLLSCNRPVSFVAKKAVASYPVIGDIATSLGSV
ncbi:hypothetical protein Pmar_PMAR022114, partial [Perkinsus marinus ATCC 50983]